MDMQGSRVLAVTQEQAWDALNDPETLKQCITGCERLERTADNEYAVGMALRIGPVSARFSGKIVLSDMAPPHSYTLSFEGQGGPAGFGKGRASVGLKPLVEDTGGCELNYTVHAQVGGKIAQLGQRLVDGAAKSMADDFFKRFDQQMQSRYPGASVPLQPVAGDPAFPAESAATDGIVTPLTGMANQKLPPWAWLALAAIATGLFIYLID